MKRVCLLGSTGSIGRSALAVMARHADRFRVVGIAAHSDAEGLAEQVALLDSPTVVLSDPKASPPPGAGRSWKRGREALIELAASGEADIVLNAVVGAAGLEPTVAALEAGRTVALANKESLVAGGELVLRAAERGGGVIVPIDSEHSAILQCIEGRGPGAVASITLTASGGPFRGRDAASLVNATARDALRHPTWEMGSKITVDSATLANKALEVIEAHFLYSLDYDRVNAVVHPQSIVHSFVEFVDGSVLAQLSLPNMELPILYALGLPERIPDRLLRTFDPIGASPLTFEEIDRQAFPMYDLGRWAGEAGGAAPATYNAGNEIAVQAFLRGRIRFSDIVDVAEAALTRVGSRPLLGVADVIAVDRDARRAAREAIDRTNQPTEPSR